MKGKILFGLLLFVQFAFGQTGKPVKVLGTKCSLIPPVGFVASATFSGFQDSKSGASIMINEFPSPYQSFVDGFSVEALRAKGMTLVNKETIDFNKSKATLIYLTQLFNGNTYIKQVLIFGDSTQSVLVNGIYPEASKYIETAIREALLTTVYDASQNDDPLEAAPFTIDVSNTEFKPVKYISGSLLYSTDGKMPTKKPTLIVGISIAKVPSQNQKKYAEERLKKLPGGDRSVIKEINEIIIDNLQGFELIADGKTEDNMPELVYLIMLFNDKGDYSIILGQAKEDIEKHLKIFKRVSKTFKRK